MKALLRTFLLALVVSKVALAGEYKLKNASRFESGKSSRSPFWPVGYVKSGTDKAGGGGSIGLKAADFKVTSIFLGGIPRMALINGKDYAEGQTVTIQVGTFQAKATLINVFDGGVVLQHQGEKIMVPLRRL